MTPSRMSQTPRYAERAGVLRPRRRRSRRRARTDVLVGPLGRVLALGLVILAGVQRLARQLASARVEQPDLEQVAAVVVGREQREALLDDGRLVDGKTRELGARDRTAGHERAPPDERHRRLGTVLAAPGPDHLLADVERPVRVALGRLLGV